MSCLEEIRNFKTLAKAKGQSHRPKYKQLQEFLASRIESGIFKAGDALPSESLIAKSLQLGLSTVRQAMSLLEQAGLVRRVHGSGTFVHDQARMRLNKSSHLLALILPETETGFYPSLQESFAEAAAGHHYQIIVCNTGNEAAEQDDFISKLIKLRVAGVAIVPTTHASTSPAQIQQLQRMRIPVICCSRRVQGVRSPLLAIPFEDVGRLAGEAIRSHGHRRVLFVTTSETEWTRTYERSLRAALGDGIEVQVFYGETSTPSITAHEVNVAAMLDRVFDTPHPPTAIFATFDSFAELLYVLLTAKGLRVPEDVSLLGFGGMRRHGALARRLTSITLDEVYLGHLAVGLLSRMRKGELPIDLEETFEMPLGLSEGNMLGRVPVESLLTTIAR